MAFDRHGCYECKLAKMCGEVYGFDGVPPCLQIAMESMPTSTNSQSAAIAQIADQIAGLAVQWRDHLGKGDIARLQAMARQLRTLA